MATNREAVMQVHSSQNQSAVNLIALSPSKHAKRISFLYVAVPLQCLGLYYLNFQQGYSRNLQFYAVMTDFTGPRRKASRILLTVSGFTKGASFTLKLIGHRLTVSDANVWFENSYFFSMIFIHLFPCRIYPVGNLTVSLCFIWKYFHLKRLKSGLSLGAVCIFPCLQNAEPCLKRSEASNSTPPCIHCKQRGY